MQSELNFWFPETESTLDQDEEWVYVKNGGPVKRLRLHDYADIFNMPGLYEALFNERLECHSPQKVVSLLESYVQQTGENMEALRILDLGAGGGLVAEQLRRRGCGMVVGTDILPEARNAAMRDRPQVYDAYHVLNFQNASPEELRVLQKNRFNALVTVAALGFGDIPTSVFRRAYDMIPDGGWVAFNIRDKFMHNGHGFREAIADLPGFEQKHCELYQHRLSIRGDPIHYYAVIGRKHEA